MGWEDGRWTNCCWPAEEEDGTPLVRLHKRRPMRPRQAAPRTPPTTPPTSATLPLLLPLPFPVPPVFAGKSSTVRVTYSVDWALASLSIDLTPTLATLSNDDCLAERLESDLESSD